jgi:hypothetical protein
MTVDLEEIQCFAADTVEFTILVEDCSVAKTISKENTHNGRGKSGGRWVRDGFHASKAAHSAGSDEVRVRSFKPGMFPGDISIEIDYQKWGLDREVVDKLGGLSATRVG